MTVAFGNSLRKWCTKQFPATIAFASVFYGGYGWDDVLHKCQKMAGKGCPWLLLCCLHLLLNLLSFGSHNWDSSSISGFLSTIQNENRKKQGPGVIIKYCCSMGIWWMIIVLTFFVTPSKNFEFIHSIHFLQILNPTYVYTWCITNRKNSEIEVLSPSITKECRVITSSVIIIIKQENSVEQTREIPSEFFQWGHNSWKCRKNLRGAAEFFAKATFVTTWKWLSLPYNYSCSTKERTIITRVVE